MVTVGEWLGAEYKTKGVKRVLADRIKLTLAAASTKGMWDMDDVPSFGSVDDAHLDEAGKMLKRFLGTVLTDVEAESKAAVTKAGSGDLVTFSGTERMRLDEWVDGLVLSHKQPVVAPQVLSTAQVDQLQVDMKVQGMTDESDLLWFELTRHTGRPAAPGDTDGGTYLGTASATKGGVAHRKAGGETYSKVLKEAVEHEDFKPDSAMERAVGGGAGFKRASVRRSGELVDHGHDAKADLDVGRGQTRLALLAAPRREAHGPWLPERKDAR